MQYGDKIVRVSDNENLLRWLLGVDGWMMHVEDVDLSVAGVDGWMVHVEECGRCGVVGCGVV